MRREDSGALGAVASAGDDAQAEGKANKLLENAGQLTTQLGGAINKYFNEGRQQLATIYEKAEIKVKEAGKKLRETGGDQYQKAVAQVQGVFTSVRSSMSTIGTSKPDAGSPAAAIAEATSSA